MKSLLTLILLIISLLSYGQTYTVVQINAKWNRNNDVQLPKNIDGANTIYGFLEDQPASLQKTTKAVPTIILYKDNTPITQWSAGLSFKLNITKEEIENAIREDKQTYQRAGSN